MLPENTATHNITEIVAHPESGLPVINRIPESLRIQLNPNARQRALHSIGCEIRFRLNSPTATLRIRACETGAPHHGGGMAQILFGDFSHTYFPVGQTTSTIEVTAPDYDLLEKASPAPLFSPRLMRILLPTHSSITQLEIDGVVSPPEVGDLSAKRMLNYGSSITQGSGGLTSRESWAGRCAHLLRHDLINLGFGGGCHCEPEMTDYLCHRNDFDIAILETGINMLGMEPKEANQRIVHLIRSFQKTHADKPTFCLGVFPCNEDVKNGFAGRAREIHQLVEQTVREIDSPQLHFIDGSKALDHPFDMTTDLTHPSPAGMISIGEYVAKQIQNIL
jgi:hypothetical protein